MYIYNRNSLPEPVFEGHEDWVELYYSAWETAFQNVEYVRKEGWKPQLTCMPGVGVIWQWDSCFMTFITNYSNGTLNALNNLDNLYRLRNKETGFMAMAVSIATEKETYPGRINPPLMAWAEWEHYRVTGDKSRFETVLPALEGIYRYIEENRRRGDGLYWFEDPGSSGMDNSPRGGYLCDDLDGSDVCFIDLACQQSLSAKCLSRICGVLGDTGKQSFYASENERINALINRTHWSEKGGWYYDFFTRGGPGARVKLIPCKTAAAFWAILCGAATGERRQKVFAHMFNEEEFYTKIPFASLSRDDLNYDPKGGYWLGGVWPPTNYAAVRGLRESGSPELAREASVRFLDAMCRIWKDPAYGSIWEAYAPEAYRPSTTEKGEIVRSSFVGWGGLAPIPMLIEDIIGLRFEGDKNTVNFRIFPDSRCGLRNMRFAGGTVSVECVEYRPYREQTVVLTKSDVPFTLSVETNYLWSPKKFEVPAGEHRFLV